MLSEDPSKLFLGSLNDGAPVRNVLCTFKYDVTNREQILSYISYRRMFVY